MHAVAKGCRLVELNGTVSPPLRHVSNCLLQCGIIRGV